MGGVERQKRNQLSLLAPAGALNPTPQRRLTHIILLSSPFVCAAPERGEEVSQRLTRFGYRAGAACSRVFTIARENVCRKVKLRTASPATGGESVDPSSWSAISFCKAALVTWSNFST